MVLRAERPSGRPRALRTWSITDLPMILSPAPARRVESLAKVSGAARYTADIQWPGTVWGRVLRSPYAHARIARLDVAAARSAPGVLAVLTAADLPPGQRTGRRIHDMPVLADGVVRYVGEPVVAVAAERREDAEAALGLVEVTYEELPALLSIEAALAPGAAPVHPDFASYKGAPKDLPPGAPANVTSHYRLEQGSVRQGFAEADLVVEEAFETPIVHHVYLEPHATLVRFTDEPGGERLEVWASHKQPFALRDFLGGLFGLPVERVRVYPALIGGDFGGKGSPLETPIAAYLARATGQPVRMVMTQVEELAASNPRHAARLTLRTGLSREGRIVAREATIDLASGAYATHRPLPHGNLSGVAKAGGAYRVPNTRITSRTVYTHHVPCGHMRAPGSVQALFAVESHMDTCAKAAGLDPAEFRRRNVVREGDASAIGERWEHVLAPEVLDRTLQRAEAFRRQAGDAEGVGIAFGMYATGVGTSGAILRAADDGSVTLVTATPDTGTGSHTLLARVVAEELSLPLERVRVHPAPTDEALFDSGSGGTRVTHVAGTAAQQTAARLRELLAAAAAERLGCPPEQLAQDRADGSFFDPRLGEAGPRLPFAAVVAEARALDGREDGQPLEVRGEFTPAHRPEQESFVGCAAHVAVDRATGAVQVRRLALVADVGTVLFPLGLMGQLQGSVVQGLGFALSEECPIDDTGRVSSSNLHEYKIPCAVDVPPLEIELVTESPGPGPYGAKGVGELAIGVVAPAVANAIEQAAGVRLRTLPIAAEAVLQALRARPAAG